MTDYSTNPRIDIELISARRKHQWKKENGKRRSLLDWLDVSIPWWVLIIGLASFILSAQHTVSVFSQITPVAGIAPFLVEFTLLWGAFSRVRAKERDIQSQRFTRIMEVLAFLVSVIVNLVGAITFVQDKSGIAALSLSSVIAQFGTLPTLTQAGLIVCPLFAFFIPGTAILGGEGIASQIADYRKTGGFIEEQWRDVQLNEIAQAIYAELVRNGQIADAKREAWRLATGYLNVSGQRVRADVSADVPKVLAELAQSSAALLPEPVRTMSRTSNGQSSADARAAVRRYLADNPDAVSLSVRKLGEAVGVSKTIAAEELAIFKAEQGQ